MPSMGLQIAAEVGQAMAAQRLKREEKDAKAGKGQQGDHPKPGQFGKSPETFNRGPSEGAYQQQRGGEHMDLSGQPAPEEFGVDATGGMDYMGFDMTPQMGASVYGSGKFSAADIKRGYRSLGKA